MNDQQAWETANENRGLAVWAVQKTLKLRSYEVEFDDAVQEAMIVLFYSARTWDPARGTFSTYAMRILPQRLRRWRCLQAGVTSYAWKARTDRTRTRAAAFARPVRIDAMHSDFIATDDDVEERALVHVRLGQLIASCDTRQARWLALIHSGMPWYQANKVVGTNMWAVRRWIAAWRAAYGDGEVENVEQ